MLALVPMILIPSFKRLSWLNLVGCLSTVLVTLVLLLSVLMDMDRSRMPLQVSSSLFWLRPVSCCVFLAMPVAGRKGVREA